MGSIISNVYNIKCLEIIYKIIYRYESYGVTGAVINYMQQKILDFWNYHIQKLDKDFGKFLMRKIRK